MLWGKKIWIPRKKGLGNTAPAGQFWPMAHMFDTPEFLYLYIYTGVFIYIYIYIQ